MKHITDHSVPMAAENPKPFLRSRSPGHVHDMQGHETNRHMEEAYRRHQRGGDRDHIIAALIEDTDNG